MLKNAISKGYHQTPINLTAITNDTDGGIVSIRGHFRLVAGTILWVGNVRRGVGLSFVAVERRSACLTIRLNTDRLRIFSLILKLIAAGEAERYKTSKRIPRERSLSGVLSEKAYFLVIIFSLNDSS